MPLEDLIDLGYQVARPPDTSPAGGPAPPLGATVWGHDKQWWVQPGEDEEAVVDLATNHAALYDKLGQAQTYFADTYANWATLTAPQKDTAMRNAMRALTNLIRHVRADLSTGGS